MHTATAASRLNASGVMMPHEMVSVPGLSEPVGVFVHATKVPSKGQLVFVSGMTSRDKRGSVVGVGDVQLQTRQALDNLALVLRTVGATFRDVAKVTVYLKDMADFAAVHEIRAEYFVDALPASTMLEVSRFVHDEMLVEIDAVVHVDN